MKRTTKPEAAPDPDRKRINAIIASLSKEWGGDERETSVLFDYHTKTVLLETSYPSTARRWVKNLWGDKNVIWDLKADTVKVTVPWSYCRSADLILKAEHRNK